MGTVQTARPAQTLYVTIRRDELRQFFRTQIPAEIRRKVSEGRKLSREDIVTTQRVPIDSLIFCSLRFRLFRYPLVYLWAVIQRK